MFFEACEKAYKEKKYPKLKERIESVLKEEMYGEAPLDGQLHLHCGKVNLQFGYLIVAESMLQDCL